MFWRFGEAAGEGGNAPLLYDEVRHRLRNGEGPWIRLPHNPALILSLLLRMQARGRTVSPREICAFLELPEGTRVRGHVTELRKRLTECGVDPERVIEHNAGNTGYRLAAGVHAAPLVEADAISVIDGLLASAETAAPSVREQLTRLRGMLLLCVAVALGFTGGLVLRPEAEVHVARVDEEGSMAGMAVPHRACFELVRELGLRDQDVLAVELSRPSPHAPSHVVISVERERWQDGATAVAFDIQPGFTTPTVRIRARELEPGVRSHARRICIGEPGDTVRAASGPSAIELQAIRIE